MTLIEVMTVVAILGTIMVLAIGGFNKMVAKAGPQNAASDFIAQLNVARARATQTGNDVWVIIYPAGGPTSRQRGAWYLVEDTGGFGDFAGASPSSFNYRDHFTPATLNGTTSRLLKSQLIWDYSAISVQFGYNRQFVLKAPFTDLTATSVANTKVACSICTPTGTPSANTRGAIVFKPDGSARFYDGDGNLLPDRSASFALEGTRDNRAQAYLFAIARSTGFIAMVQR